jgi:bile acid:Na+ symporter, BASS family
MSDARSLPAPLRWLGTALAFIGRHGAAGFALSIFVGLALPGLAATMRPVLPVSIFCFVALSFARADFGGVARVARRPAILAVAFLWITLGMPAMLEAGLLVVGRDAVSPGLLLGIALVAAAPPLMGFPAYAALLRIDNSLGMALLVLSLVITPLIAPPLASMVAGEAVPIDSTTLALRLLVLLAGAGAASLILRASIGPRRLAERRQVLDGINVVLYFVFAIAAMDGVITATLADPGRTARFLAIGSGLAALGFASAQLAMRALGPAQAFVMGLGTGMRNTGLLVAAMGSACPPDTYLFFALLQFPIYCAPLMVTPLARLMVPAAERST